MNFLTKVKDWEVSSTSWRKSARRVPLTDSQVVADHVRRELMRTLKQWMTLYWVRKTSPKCTDRGAKSHVKLAFTVPVSIGYSLWSSTQVPQRCRAQQLSEANRVARLTRCKQLLKRYDDSAVDFTWFTEEKVFTVEHPFTSQNDRVYVPMNQEAIRSAQPPAMHALDVQQVCYGVSCRVKNGCDWANVCRPRS